MKSRSTWSLKEGQTLRIGSESLRMTSIGSRGYFGEVHLLSQDDLRLGTFPDRIVSLGEHPVDIGGAAVTAQRSTKGRREALIRVEQILEVRLLDPV